MTRYPLPQLLLAVPVALLGAPPASLPQPDLLLGVEFQGGSEDDVAFARVASGLAPGAPLTDPAFQTALAAIRLTDRFRKVEGSLLAGPDGVRAQVRLDPWPTLAHVVWRGDARLPGVRKLIRGLRAGMRPGALRLDVWTQDLQARMVEAGYPEARVQWSREHGDQDVVIAITAGQGTLVRKVEVLGALGPYSAEEIRGFAKLVPGRSLWTQAAQQEAYRNVRKRFQSDRHYEAQVSLDWDGQGTARITVTAGPKVTLVAEGDGLGLMTSLKDLIPLTRADRYSPELLDEGDRRIVRYFRAKGYLDVQVGHRREVTRALPAAFQEVTVTYSIHRGAKSRLDEVRFEGNVAVDEATLKEAAGPTKSLLSFGASAVTPERMDLLEDRVKAVYLGQGFTEVALRRTLEHVEGRTQLVFRIQEGPRRMLQRVSLELPPGGFGDPWSLGDALALIFSDQAVPRPGPVRTYLSDRRTMAGVQGVLTRSGDDSAPMVLSLVLDRPIPLLKNDLTRVFSALRQQRLPALGIVRPVIRLNLEADGALTAVRIQVPAQPQEKIQRLVVSGSNKTRARAVLRETRLQPGSPLATEQLSRAQARLSYLGAFQRVDLNSLADQDAEAAPKAAAGGPAAPAGPPVPWKEGDLQLNLEERPPWVLTNSFGYDKSQGYHVGVGVQQLNVGGMGRTIDYGVRAGNGFIQNPTLAKWFPTGTYNRSVDSVSVGYTDPWFAPGLLAHWLPDRTQFRSEAAYIQELQSLYQIRRRRVLNSLQWSLTPRVSFSLGHRWERVDVAAALPGVSSEELSVLARYPSNTVISAPFAQVSRDSRDNAFDPTSGMYSVARVEFANQLFLTSSNSSFVKLDLRNQWTWPMGYKARAGVVALGMRLGVAKPTAASARNLPLSERFFAGGPFSFRGVEPDALGTQTHVPLRYLSGANVGQIQTDSNGNPILYATPTGGQGLVLINLEYRFPLLGQSVWGEIFADSGQVYESLTRLSTATVTFTTDTGTASIVQQPPPLHPPLRTALGFGLIFKVGIPLKIEYAADVKRILGKARSQDDRDTQLKSLLVSAGFQF